MSLFKSSLPSAVLAALPRTPGEKVYASTQCEGGEYTWAVLTNRACYLIPSSGSAIRAPWTSVFSAGLENNVLTIRWNDDRPSTRLMLNARRAAKFTRVFREQVDSSVVLTVPINLLRGSGVVTVRRDENGKLVTDAMVKGALSLDDPEVKEAIETAERRAHDATGEPPATW